MRDAVLRKFEVHYRLAPTLLARAPGRVNLIGEYTDYNDGFVLPIAIDRAVWIALRPRSDRRVRVHSMEFGESVELDLDRLSRTPGSWLNYVSGIASALSATDAALVGWDGVIGGDVPVGAGLSSSAALELAVARAFAEYSHIEWDPTVMAQLAQRAENDWVGVNCGIMDPIIVASGVEGHALLIDCRSLESRPVPIPDEAAVVVLDTGTRRELTTSAYNDRRRECEAAAHWFGAPALRDVTWEDFTSRAAMMDEKLRRRARHVISENARTVAAANALSEDQMPVMGALMTESHASLRDDFEVSRRELDLMVVLALSDEACFGARMTGAGFGGCAVALVDRTEAGRFARDVSERYKRNVEIKSTAYVCSASAGASVERL